MTALDRLVDAVLRLAGAGLYVFPCRPGSKIPATAHGFKDATRDPATIRRWWADRPAANIGIATGPSGLGVVDLDGPEGIATWRALTAEHPTDRTLTARTPSGGAHLYFRDPAGRLRSLVRRLGPGIDTKGIGGCVVAPPSRRGARRYTWCEGPQFARLPDVPGWIVAALQPPAGPPASAVEARQLIGDTRHRKYAERALEGEVQAVLDAAPGTRNATLNAAAYCLGQLVGAGLLNEAATGAALTLAGEAVGLPLSEVHRTVRSGLTAGAAHPRRVVA